MYGLEMFENMYAQYASFWGQTPNRIVTQMLKYLKHGTVLDLGLGEGRDALFLAMRGFYVDGIDIAQIAIDKVTSIVSEFHLAMTAEKADIRDYQISREYDAILCLGVLQLLDYLEITSVIDQIKKKTSRGGLNVISAFTLGNPRKECPYPSPDGSFRPYYLFAKNELGEMYAGWDILEYMEYMTGFHQHEDGVLHQHAVVSIIARKR